MKKITLLIVIFLTGVSSFGQDTNVKQEKAPGHYNISKFRQLKQELPTPNSYRTASGIPGHQENYYNM